MAVDGKRLGGSNRVLTMREAADFLRLPYKTFARSYKGWGISYFNQGRFVYFRERHLIAYIESRET